MMASRHAWPLLLALCALSIHACNGAPAGRAFAQLAPVELRLGQQTARVDGHGLSFGARDAAWSVELRTTRWGDTAAPAPVPVERDGERATLRHDAFDEWYRVDGEALEHGYTIADRPASGAAHMHLALGGLSVASIDADGVAWLADQRGRLRAGYGGLKVWDALGTRLPARIAGEGAALRLEIDDAGAHYPLHVDPVLWAIQQLLVASNPMFWHDFGDVVAIDGDVLAVADADEDPVLNGAVYMFERSGTTWSEVVKLEAPDEAQFALDFGSSLDLDGDTVVVGATGAEAGAVINAGAAYVFTKVAGSWVFQQKLTASDAAASDYLGTAVAISGDTIAVSAAQADAHAFNVGAVFIFERSAGVWTQTQKIVEATTANNDFWGNALSLEGDTLAIAARRDSNDIGAIYVYQRAAGVFSPQAKLVPQSPTINGLFGSAVALSGDSLIAGAKNYDNVAGRGYVFVRNGVTWSEQAWLQHPNPQQFEDLGHSAAIEGDTVVLGAVNWGPSGTGAAFVFTRSGTTWTFDKRLEALTPNVGDRFGESVAIDQGRILVGATEDDETVADAGTAWLFASVGQSCVSDAQCASAACADGFCCNTQCDGGCTRCDVPDTEGQCTPLPTGDPGNPGCGVYLCDGGLACPTSCDTHDDCIATHFCDVDACEPLELPGSPCSDAFECASGICADGVCCDAACAGQCEACDVAGAEGTCTLVMGQPHAGHEPCPSDGCSGGVGDTAYSCSGEATCTPLLTTCEPYACASDGCYETCLSDAQCVDGYDCVLETGVCISRDPICDGVDELALPGGGTLPCRPYRCTALGACLDGCISSGDCSPGFACSSDQRCVERPPPIEPPGCAYRSAPAPDRSPTTFLWLIAAAWIAQRRSQTAKTFARTRARL